MCESGGLWSSAGPGEVKKMLLCGGCEPFTRCGLVLDLLAVQAHCWSVAPHQAWTQAVILCAVSHVLAMSTGSMGQSGSRLLF